ncbi:MAG: ABC transporter ATP-binding protein [Anaerolineae bacterium]|nr:ABC transporter ATP-binding protein [Anaerolineae bacterium]
MLDLAPAVVAVRRADAGKQHPQVIVHLRHRADGAARVFADRLLLDGDSRAEAADKIHLRFFHLPQKLPGVRGQALDVATLPLGVKGIEGQRRLAAAADPGKNHQLVARNVHVNAAQIVLPRSANHDFVLRKR